jgi:hypothetical protein
MARTISKKNNLRKNLSSLATNNNINPFRRMLTAVDEKDNSQTYTHRIALVQAVSGSVTGCQYNVALNSVSSGLDWSSFSALYDEFRVLGARLHYQPVNQYTANSQPVSFYYDNDQTSVTPSSNVVAFSYANARAHTSNLRTTYDGIFAFTSDGPEPWHDTLAPSAQLGVIGIFTSNSFGSSITIANSHIEFICEFRGRR